MLFLALILSLANNISAAELISPSLLEELKRHPLHPENNSCTHFTAYTHKQGSLGPTENFMGCKLSTHHDFHVNCTQSSTSTSIFLTQSRSEACTSLGISFQKSIFWTPKCKQNFATLYYIENGLKTQSCYATNLYTKVITANTYAIVLQQSGDPIERTLLTVRTKPQQQAVATSAKIVTSWVHYPTVSHSCALQMTFPLMRDRSLFIGASSASLHTISVQGNQTVRDISLTQTRRALEPNALLSEENPECADIICTTKHSLGINPEQGNIFTNNTKEDFTTTLRLYRGDYNESIRMTTKKSSTWLQEDTFFAACTYKRFKGKTLTNRKSIHLVATRHTRSILNPTYALSVRGSFGSYFLSKVEAKEGTPTSVMRSTTTDSIETAHMKHSASATHTLYLSGQPIVALEASSKGLIITPTNKAHGIRLYYDEQARGFVYTSPYQEA